MKHTTRPYSFWNPPAQKLRRITGTVTVEPSAVAATYTMASSVSSVNTMDSEPSRFPSPWQSGSRAMTSADSTGSSTTANRANVVITGSPPL